MVLEVSLLAIKLSDGNFAYDFLSLFSSNLKLIIQHYVEEETTRDNSG